MTEATGPAFESERPVEQRLRRVDDNAIKINGERGSDTGARQAAARTLWSGVEGKQAGCRALMHGSA